MADSTSCCGGAPAESRSTSSADATRAASADSVRDQVRQDYAKVANASNAGTSTGVVESCCGVAGDAQITSLISTRLGYSEEDVSSVPEGADMGLGCGNPRAIAGLSAGEVVLDLGSGGGFDCFLAAPEVGAEGRVIGIDMTPDMVSKARRNAERGAYETVEFRLGEIEHMPVADGTVDVIISNCVINLSPNKAQVFREAFRVLKKGGRLAISDLVTTAELPKEIRESKELFSGCMAGATLIDELETMMRDAGFCEIAIAPKNESKDFIRDWAPGRGIEELIVSATIEAIKPNGCC
ncbi:MAG: arsenite S-adenosylmethyltransferase [Deltaproteobacteria bacterium]|nr:MAG: arsenite S-adenosylmethyltransferase [Deltaproteobacteria bacterium]